MFRSISSIYEPANEVMYMCLLPDLGTNPRVHDVSYVYWYSLYFICKSFT
jgi:hypothetical protein